MILKKVKSLPPCRYQFPSLDGADEDGLVAVGGDLSPSTLVEAYSCGLFPWPSDEDENYIPWFSPVKRGVLEFNDLHISRSFRKWVRQTDFDITYDKAFQDVVSGCAHQKRPGQEGTWLYPFMEKAYARLYEMGYAHSVECWSGEVLVGGLYGILTDKFFSAESMFYTESGASKYCFIKVIEALQGLGHRWMDIQMVTPVTEGFGGKYISRQEFLKLIQG